MTVPAGPGTALQVARSLAEVNDTLSDLTLTLILVCLGGVALAAGLGLLVARTSLAPAAAVSAAAKDVAETKDLTRRIDVKGSDELASMAASFNAMLEALEESVGAQRRLVADASHELRTPLATLRTNIETLERQETLEPRRAQARSRRPPRRDGGADGAGRRRGRARPRARRGHRGAPGRPPRRARRRGGRPRPAPGPRAQLQRAARADRGQRRPGAA